MINRLFRCEILLITFKVSSRILWSAVFYLAAKRIVDRAVKGEEKNPPDAG